MISRVAFTLIVFGICCGHGGGQGHPDLDKLDEKVKKHFERVLPGWMYKRGTPIVETENVLIQFWYSPNRAVKIAVIPHRSGDEAREAVRDFIKYERTPEIVKDIGDEAYAWGYGASNIAFRRGRLVFYVSSRADVDADADARTLSREQRFDKEKTERRRLSVQFAKHAMDAADAP